MTAFTVDSSKRFSIDGIWPCASNSSVVTFDCCSCSPTIVIPAHSSTRALPVAIAAGSLRGACCIALPMSCGLEVRLGKRSARPLPWRCLLSHVLACLLVFGELQVYFPVLSVGFSQRTHQPVDEVHQFSSCVLVIASLPVAVSIYDCRRGGVMWRRLVALWKLVTRASYKRLVALLLSFRR